MRIQHALFWVCLCIGAGGRGNGWCAGGGWSRGGKSDEAHWGCCRVLGCCHLRTGGIELPPLVIKNRSLMLPLNPSPGHQAQSVNALPQVGVESLLKVVDKSNVS